MFGLQRFQKGADVDSSPPMAPEAKGRPLLGYIPELRRDTLGTFLRFQRQYGDIVRFQLGPRLTHLVSEPELLKHVFQTNNRNYIKGRGLVKAREVIGEGLLTSEGDFWRRQRRLAQPAFHRQKIGRFTQMMTESTAKMLERWQPMVERGEAFDISAEMMGLTLDIVSQTLFSTALTDDEVQAVHKNMTPMLRELIRRLRTLFDFWDRLPLPRNYRFRGYIADLDQVIYRIIEERRQSGEEKDDLLGMLMAARDEETNEQMNDRQLRDEAMTIFLAGHETTANLLSWLCYLLSLHPDIRQKVTAEVDQVLQGRTPTLADVPQLTYTRMVIDEVLRLYPPAWGLARRALSDDMIGGYHVPAGSYVFLVPYVTHRHPTYWPNPEGFDPERFRPEKIKERPKYAYFPFGGGPRLCIGNNFALLEATLIVAMITQRYELNMVAGHPVVPEVTFTLRPKHGLLMRVQKR